MKEYVENMKKYVDILDLALPYRLWDLEKFQALSPCRLWNLEKLRAVPAYRLWDLENKCDVVFITSCSNGEQKISFEMDRQAELEKYETLALFFDYPEFLNSAAYMICEGGGETWNSSFSPYFLNFILFFLC